MDNIGIVILSIFVMIAFVVFIVASIKEISKMEKEGYQYKKPVFGRDALYNILEKLFNDDKLSEKEKKNLLKTISQKKAFLVSFTSVRGLALDTIEQKH